MQRGGVGDVRRVSLLVICKNIEKTTHLVLRGISACKGKKKPRKNTHHKLFSFKSRDFARLNYIYNTPSSKSFVDLSDTLPKSILNMNNFELHVAIFATAMIFIEAWVIEDQFCNAD